MLETSSLDNWDYSMLENNNQCGCYNVGGTSTNELGRYRQVKYS